MVQTTKQFRDTKRYVPSSIIFRILLLRHPPSLMLPSSPSYVSGTALAVAFSLLLRPLAWQKIRHQSRILLLQYLLRRPAVRRRV